MSSPSKTPWVNHLVINDEDTGILEGNRAGFEVLLEQIQIALEHGEALPISENLQCDWQKIIVRADDYQQETDSPCSPTLKFGCLFILAIAAVIFLIGLVTTIGMIIAFSPLEG
jgi:hypothetical protein